MVPYRNRKPQSNMTNFKIMLLLLLWLSDMLELSFGFQLIHQHRLTRKSMVIGGRNNRNRHYLPSSNDDMVLVCYGMANDDDDEIIISYRLATKEDISNCFEIEKASYPSDEAATLKSLTYRQENANEYFLCAFLENDLLIGFICSTRCSKFEEDTMTTHDPNGPILAIHSVVIEESYRRKGYASHMMKHYLHHHVKDNNNNNNNNGIDKIALLAKSHLLGFYVNAGFSVIGPSPIIHGKEQWYDLQLVLEETKTQQHPRWFVKTEQFKKPYPVVKPFLDLHKEWVNEMRLKSNNHDITSGYRVDSNGKPGGGGMMFFTAKDYSDALEFVKQDPLIANDCVDWRLNEWIAQVGNITVS